MAKLIIKNDAELARLLKEFFERLATKCGDSTAERRYLANAAKALSAQYVLFLSELEVHSYGHLKTFCKNDLPSNIDPDKIFRKATQELDLSKSALLDRYPYLASFNSAEQAKLILDPQWSPAEYRIATDLGSTAIGKRHPYKMAAEALKHAARRKTDSLYEKAIWALEWYIDTDTSLLEVFKRINESFDDVWGEKNIALTTNYAYQRYQERQWIVAQFDPYEKHFNPEMDFRHKEKAVSAELIVQLSNLRLSKA